MGTPVVQIADVQDFSSLFTACGSPVWRARLWVNPYEKKLPFMADKDTEYNRYAVSLENLIIDYLEYFEAGDFGALRENDKTWLIDPGDPSQIYVHFSNHEPPLKCLSFKSGYLYNFSHGKPVMAGNSKSNPLLNGFPDVSDSADNFRYQRMSFGTGSVSVDNSSGILDGLLELYGNDLNLLMRGEDGKTELVRQYVIESYTLGPEEAQFSVKDKRSRLSFKAPNAVYGREAYPHIDEKHIDKTMQDAYGYCRGVEGTCLDQEMIYADAGSLAFNDRFSFRFARSITSIEQILVKKNDVWVEVFPGLGAYWKADGTPGETGAGTYLETNPHPVRIIKTDGTAEDVTPSNMNSLPENNGVIQIWWSQALKDNPGHLYRRAGKADPVKMHGVFVNRRTAKDIVKDMMTYYGELPYEASYFDLEDWEAELAGQKEIGVCLDSSRNIYEWIEKIQNGGLLGFQLMISGNLFTARVDDPNRAESFDIRFCEILNRNGLAAELGGGDYASFTAINYLYDYADKESRTVIDKSMRRAVIDVYKYEKEYSNDSLLISEEDVKKKGRMILENFTDVRPAIRGIELDGLRWDSIKLFSTGWIDFSMDLPRQMKAIQIYMKKRNCMGRLRVKVLSCRRNLKTETVTVDVVQCDKLEALNEN